MIPFPPALAQIEVTHNPAKRNGDRADGDNNLQLEGSWVPLSGWCGSVVEPRLVRANQGWAMGLDGGAHPERGGCVHARMPGSGS